MRFVPIAFLFAACTYPELEGMNNPNPDANGGCVAPMTFGTASVSSQAAKYYPPTTDLPEAVAYLGKMTAANDFLDIQLVETPNSPFANGVVAPAQITLTGKESSTTTCAGCVFVVAQCVGCAIDANYTGATYIATAGTLKITQVNPKIIGTIENVTLKHVTIDAQGVSTFHADGCMTQIASASFNTTVQQ